MADYTTTQRDALKNALATGGLTVRYGETTTTYRSLDEMRSILADMNRELNTAAGKKNTRIFRIAGKRAYELPAADQNGRRHPLGPDPSREGGCCASRCSGKGRRLKHWFLTDSDIN